MTITLPHRLLRQGPRPLRRRRRPAPDGRRRTGSRCSTSCCRTPIPDKGRVLTAISSFWFDQVADLLPNHVISVDPADFPAGARPDADGRAMLVRRTSRSAMECIVRGYLFGGGVEGVPGARARCRAVRCRPGMQEAERLPEPLFTPTTKAERATTSRCPTREAVDAGRRGHVRPAAGRRARDLRARRGARPRRAASSSPTRSSSSADARRRAAAHRRGADARLVAVLAGGGLRGRRVAAVVRQAVRPRPLPDPRLGPDRRPRRRCPPT